MHSFVSKLLQGPYCTRDSSFFLNALIFFIPRGIYIFLIPHPRYIVAVSIISIIRLTLRCIAPNVSHRHTRAHTHTTHTHTHAHTGNLLFHHTFRLVPLPFQLAFVFSISSTCLLARRASLERFQAPNVLTLAELFSPASRTGFVIKPLNVGTSFFVILFGKLCVQSSSDI